MKEQILAIQKSHNDGVDYILSSTSHRIYSLYSLEKAIQHIESGDTEFVVIGKDNSESKVIVRSRDGKKYLATTPDYVVMNNLLEVDSLYVFL